MESKPGVPDDWLGVRAPERETLTGTLDWYRGVVIGKLDGLSRGQAVTKLGPSGLSLMGVVKHLAWVETGWFRDTFAGELVEEEISAEQSFRVSRVDTIASVITTYHDACVHARRIANSSPSLAALSARPTDLRGHVSLRWLLVHLIEETARHAGHLDLMREQVDGRTGD